MGGDENRKVGWGEISLHTLDSFAFLGVFLVFCLFSGS